MSSVDPWSDLKRRRGAEGTEAYERSARAQRIGRALAELRQGAGLSQAVVADRMGIKQPNVARIERGSVEPTIDTLERYAEAVGHHVQLAFIVESKAATARRKPAALLSLASKRSLEAT